MMSLREKRLELRTKHHKRCLRDSKLKRLRDRKLKRFRNKSVQAVENNNCVPTRKKPVIVVLYER